MMPLIPYGDGLLITAAALLSAVEALEAMFFDAGVGVWHAAPMKGSQRRATPTLSLSVDALTCSRLLHVL